MKSQCTEYQKRIWGLFFGDLNSTERRELEEHLTSCPQCHSERARYAETLDKLKLVEEEPVPGHFFVHPMDERLSIREFFMRLRPTSQILTLTTGAVILLLGIAALSQLKVQVNRGGFSLNFGSNGVDAVALKQEIIQAADAKSRESKAALIQEIRTEIAQSRSDLSRQQRAELRAVLLDLNARLNGRIAQTEKNLKEDSRKIIADLYQAVSRQQVRNLDIINLRFESAEFSNAIKERQTDEILNTLLQDAELRLR
jgi:hypothetical protein